MDVAIACICPPKDGETRHAEDRVTLPDFLDFRSSLTVRQTIKYAAHDSQEEGEPLKLAELRAVMLETYLLHCISGWTCQQDGAKGKPEPLPLTKANVRAYLLVNQEAAEQVGDAADELYSEKVVLPLLTRASTPSPDTSTPEAVNPPSTSATNGSSTKPRRRSKPSSTSTSPMVVTGPTVASPGGVSSSSPS